MALSITALVTEEQLLYLKNNGYQALSLTEAIEKLKHKTSEEEKFVVLTIDDAYQSFYQNALPLLKRYEMPATLFVNTETVGAPDFMSWEEIKEARASGIEFGNHSHSHAYFLNGGIQEFEKDLNESEAIFNHYIGFMPKLYAYP